ncbi:hypothetical protein CC80DRAFT_597851 [Byssothecium circinans]|uniref:Uncharacterized protein n=1 Tax=Byssothecium circinans TaxID=147558 RepID=A0A6A5TF59_9PLEO|nr:hypothetical protein CC80DRAFT_597851 [Byssothecium circinans]
MTTSVPGLVLLRTCRQIHDEAPSIFYGANSFLCDVAHEVRVESAEDVHKLRFTESFLNLPDTCSPTTVGVLFPAPRYQIWLTRATINTSTGIPLPLSERNHIMAGFVRGCAVIRIVRRRFGLQAALHGQIYDKVKVGQGMTAVYDAMQKLWVDKACAWKGRLEGTPRSAGW